MEHNTTASTSVAARPSVLLRALHAATAFARREPRKALLLGIGAGVLAGALLLALAAGASIKIDLAQVVQMNYEGINEHGTASLLLDWSTFEAAVQEKYKGKAEQIEQTLALVKENVSFTVNHTEALRNGDEIALTAAWPEALSKQAKVKFKNSAQTLTVSGLPEGTVADVFEGVTLSLDGIAPYASAHVSAPSAGEYPFALEYAVTPEHGLSNGDTVTVTAQYDPAAAQKQLYFVQRSAKAFVVEGLSAYITSLAQIQAAPLEAFEQQAQALLKSKLTASALSYCYATGRGYSAELDPSSAVIESITCQKAYLLVCRTEAVFVPKNKLYLLYAVQGKDSTAPDGFLSYLLVCGKGDGIFMQPDGTLGDLQLDPILYGTARGPDANAIYQSMLASQTEHYTIEEQPMQP